jgi:hypothetical protein
VYHELRKVGQRNRENEDAETLCAVFFWPPGQRFFMASPQRTQYVMTYMSL